MVDKMLDIAGKTTPQNTFVPIQPGSKAGITLLESYYDGEKIAMGCQFQRMNLQAPIQFDIDLNDPAYAALGEMQPRKDFAEFLENPNREWDYVAEEIAARLKRDGTVTFAAWNSWLSDHVYANGEDLGCCHGDLDPEGYFTVDPMVMGIGEVELPDNCRNQPEITVTLNYCVQPVLYVLEGDSMSCATAPIQRYPVNITIQNNTQP